LQKNCVNGTSKHCERSVVDVWLVQIYFSPVNFAELDMEWL